jgi:membrane protease YdiL (CAAX protease family)
MRLGVRVFPNAPAVIVASIGTILIAAFINAMMVSFVDFSQIMKEEIFETPIQILLAFVSIAIVPALAEEFLFRGCVLSNLLPYGKKTAIILSALLFALMHGNFAQFFYTFVAGIVLAVVYIETGSIWTSTFIHLFNNFYGVIQQVVYQRCGESERIGVLLTVVDITFITLGLAAGGWLIYYRLKKGAREGFAEPTKRIELDKKEARVGFFRPVIIVHIVISLLLALFILVFALIYPLLTV